MKPTTPLLTLLAVSLAPALYAQSLNQGDRDRAMSHLHASRKMFLDATDGLTSAQWTFKAGADRWSIAEIAEHLTLTEEGIHGLVQALLKAGPPPESKPAVPADEKILEALRDRSTRANAPEILRPTGKWPDRESQVAEFKKRRDATITYVQTTLDPLRAYTRPHTLFGAIDGYQWYILMAGHTERHVAQMLEVKADPKYPK
jgi:hypothetical protein